MRKQPAIQTFNGEEANEDDHPRLPTVLLATHLPSICRRCSHHKLVPSEDSNQREMANFCVFHSGCLLILFVATSSAISAENELTSGTIQHWNDKIIIEFSSQIIERVCRNDVGAIDGQFCKFDKRRGRYQRKLCGNCRALLQLDSQQCN